MVTCNGQLYELSVLIFCTLLSSLCCIHTDSILYPQDNCAMWLNGFNDNLDGFPKVECAMVKCPDPYMGASQPGAPPDASKGKQGPFGTGSSTPEYGLCPIDKSFDNEEEVRNFVCFFD